MLGMRLLPITNQITSEIKKVEHAKKVDSVQKTRGLRTTDKSEFSANAQRLSETKANADIVNAQLVNAPDIREDKVAEVKEKIESGYYDSPEFLDKLTDKLMTDFGLTGVTQG